MVSHSSASTAAMSAVCTRAMGLAIALLVALLLLSPPAAARRQMEETVAESAVVVPAESSPSEVATPSDVPATVPVAPVKAKRRGGTSAGHSAVTTAKRSSGAPASLGVRHVMRVGAVARLTVRRVPHVRSAARKAPVASVGHWASQVSNLPRPLRPAIVSGPLPVTIAAVKHSPLARPTVIRALAKPTAVSSALKTARAGAVRQAAFPPAPAAAPTPEEMTRDYATPAASVADAGTLNPTTQIGRMLGALVIVVVLVAAFLSALKRLRLKAGSLSQGPAAASNRTGFGLFDAVMQSANPAAAMKNVLNDGVGAMQAGSRGVAPAQLPSGGLEVVGRQELPGSGAAVYLVRVGERMMLLGASPQGGVRSLAEWDEVETRNEDEKNTAFKDYLVREGMIPGQPFLDLDAADAITGKLARTSERLSRFGSQDPVRRS